jgi:hypothetical protein
MKLSPQVTASIYEQKAHLNTVDRQVLDTRSPNLSNSPTNLSRTESIDLADLEK